jgi:hypothetical protein
LFRDQPVIIRDHSEFASGHRQLVTEDSDSCIEKPDLFSAHTAVVRRSPEIIREHSAILR